MQQKNFEHRRTESEFVRSVSHSPLSKYIIAYNLFDEFTILCSTTAKYSSGLHFSRNGHNVCKSVFQAVQVWLVTVNVELYMKLLSILSVHD